eukprot:scaffold80549_cov101-Phaeocystis_antarctica.AAC.2
MKGQQLCGAKSPILGWFSTKKVAHACCGGVPGIKSRRFSPTFGVRRDKGVSRGSPFPGVGRGLKVLAMSLRQARRAALWDRRTRRTWVGVASMMRVCVK